MNILQIITKLDYSAAADETVRSTRFLTLNGHKVIVVSRASGRVKEIDQVGARHYTLSLDRNIFLFPLYAFKLSRIASRENAKVFHARDALSAFIAFFAARKRGRALVTTVYREKGALFTNRPLFWAKRIICRSNNQAQRFLAGRLAAHAKLAVIPPAIEKGPVSARSEKFKGYFVLGVSLPFSSAGSAQDFARTVSVLARSIHKMKVIVTDTLSEYGKEGTERLRLLIKRHSLEGVVNVASEPDKTGFTENLDLFVQFNTGDVTPDFILKAQARGVTVIATGSAWISDYAVDGETAVIVPAGDNRRLTSEIFTLYRDAALRKRMARAAEAAVKERCSPKKIMEETLKIYDEAVSRAKILIIKFGALGDVLLITPSVRAIRKKFPNAKIKLLVGLEQREIFANSPLIDESIVYDFKSRDRGFFGTLRIARRLAAEDFDMVVDFQNNKKSHLLSWLSCAGERYGYDNGKFSFLLNKKAKDTGLPVDPVTHQSKVLGLLGIYNIDKRLELFTSGDDDRWAEEFLRSYWIKDKSRLVAFNIDASPRWLTKLWPVKYFAEVSNRLAAEHGIRVLLLGAEKESLRKKEFLRLTRSKPIDASGRTNVTRLASLIKRCDLLVSSDSAPLHVASGVGTGFVALFGPTDPGRHAPPVRNAVILKKDLKCSPCYHTRCVRGHRCMKLIKPDEVYGEIVKMIKTKDQRLKTID